MLVPSRLVHRMVPVLVMEVGLQPVLGPGAGQLLLVPVGTGRRLGPGVGLQPVLGPGVGQLLLVPAGTGLQLVLGLGEGQLPVLGVVVARMVGRTVLVQFLVPLVRTG